MCVCNDFQLLEAELGTFDFYTETSESYRSEVAVSGLHLRAEPSQRQRARSAALGPAAPPFRRCRFAAPTP